MAEIKEAGGVAAGEGPGGRSRQEFRLPGGVLPAGVLEGVVPTTLAGQPRAEFLSSLTQPNDPLARLRWYLNVRLWILDALKEGKRLPGYLKTTGEPQLPVRRPPVQTEPRAVPMPPTPEQVEGLVTQTGPKAVPLPPTREQAEQLQTGPRAVPMPPVPPQAPAGQPSGEVPPLSLAEATDRVFSRARALLSQAGLTEYLGPLAVKELTAKPFVYASYRYYRDNLGDDEAALDGALMELLVSVGVPKDALEELIGK